MAYAVFVGIHLAGVGEALRVMFVITAIALVGLVIFAGAAVTQFDLANLTDIAPTDAAGASAFLPFGYLGIWSASWMILGPHLSETEIGENEQLLQKPSNRPVVLDRSGRASYERHFCVSVPRRAH